MVPFAVSCAAAFDAASAIAVKTTRPAPSRVMRVIDPPQAALRSRVRCGFPDATLCASEDADGYNTRPVADVRTRLKMFVTIGAVFAVCAQRSRERERLRQKQPSRLRDSRTAIQESDITWATQVARTRVSRGGRCCC